MYSNISLLRFLRTASSRRFVVQLYIVAALQDVYEDICMR